MTAAAPEMAFISWNCISSSAGSACTQNSSGLVLITLPCGDGVVVESAVGGAFTVLDEHTPMALVCLCLPERLPFHR